MDDMLRSGIEITTIIGCPVQCLKYCPQELITGRYDGARKLTFDAFKFYMETVPKEKYLYFCGFSEPFVNQETIDMIEWASARGHPIWICTTVVGLKPEDAKRLGKIPIEHMIIHMPDAFHRCEFLSYTGKCSSNGLFCLKRHGSRFVACEECLAVRNANIPNHDPEYQESLAILQDMIPKKGYMSMEENGDFVTGGPELMARGLIPAGTYKGRRYCNNLCSPNHVLMPNGNLYFCCMTRGQNVEPVGNLHSETYPDIETRFTAMSLQMQMRPSSICHMCPSSFSYNAYKAQVAFFKCRDILLRGKSIKQVMELK